MAATNLIIKVESVVTVRRISSILGYQFHWPVENSRIYALFHPEIRLVALLIVATKLCFASQGMSHLQSYGTGAPPTMPTVDWEKWQEAVNQTGHGEPERQRFDDANANKVATMSDEDLAAYFNHVSSFVEKRSMYFARRQNIPTNMAYRREPADEFLPFGPVAYWKCSFK